MNYPANPSLRRNQARKLREDAAKLAFNRPTSEHLNNQEEADFPNFIASYSKGLSHNYLGEVDPKAYQALLNALRSGKAEDLKAIPLAGQRQLSEPLLGLAFDLEGPDAQSLTLPPAPRLDGPQVAGEMAELYWMALLRDVSFRDFDRQALVTEAAGQLSALSVFQGPKYKGQVTPGTLFRGSTPADLVGPYLSQLLLKGNQIGRDSRLTGRGTLDQSSPIEQRHRTPLAGGNYLQDYPGWLKVQNGINPSGLDRLDPIPRFIRNLRDLANYVRFAAVYEPYLNACLILLAINTPFATGNPYSSASREDGYGSFGVPAILGLVTAVAIRALKATWFQKWFVHRRLRPEALGGLVHNHLQGLASYPLHPELLNSTIVETIYEANRIANLRSGHAETGTYLLPIAYPEGSPTHPAYGSGHAAVAGACVTVLKAWFDDAFVISNPVEPDESGTALELYAGPDQDTLTVGGELNKLAGNLSLGRCMAGVNWRSDCTQSLKFGEAIAIGLLEEQKLTYPEAASLTFTKFDGNRIAI